MTDVFYQPEFSVYRFFKLFFSTIKLKNPHNSTIIKGDIVKQLYKAKLSNEYNDLFDEFSFFDNGLFVSSRQVEDGISQMQLSGLISKKNPKFVELMINLDKSDCDEIIKECAADKVNKMEDLITNYVVA